MIDKKHTYFFYLFLILFLKACFILGVILYAGIGLGPDEAQYWTWSRHLDWGYYSKPPGIAWQIWLGTAFFGDTELGVRSMALVLSSLISVTIYFLALACRLTPVAAFWAGVAFACTPLGVMASFLAITDGGLALFWTLACLVTASALSEQKTPNYYLLGFVILCGALFKWPIYLFWIVVILFMPFFPVLKSKHLWGGFVISLLGLFPSFVWNYSHQWVTFRHVWVTMVGKGDAVMPQNTPSSHGNFFEFFGAQIALLSPILFGLLLLSFIALIRKRQSLSGGLFFCGASALILLVVYHFFALFQKMQGNWVAFTYPPAIVLMCWYAYEQLARGVAWLKGGVFLSLLLCVFILSLPTIQSQALFHQVQVPYKMNPFRQNLGWERLGNELTQAGYNPSQHFLFGDKYQMSSILSFYTPGQKRAYFLNLQGIRKNQFSFWRSMAQEQMGKTGFFALAENLVQIDESKIKEYDNLLKKYFHQVEFLGTKPIFFSDGVPVKNALIFKCIGYNGQEPSEVDLY